MAPTNYQRGRAFEYRTRNKLLDMGAVYVMRAAQSKGKVDLLTLWPGKSTALARPWLPYNEPDYGPGGGFMAQRPWAIQCKRDGRLPKAERQALLELYDQSGAIPILAKAGKNGRGVEFIDLRD